MTPDDHLLPSQRRPRPAQERALLTTALILVAACVVTIPFRLVPLQRVDAFIPIVDTVLFLCDLLTATLLFAQGAVLRSRALVVLATGFLFVAFIIVPHALTFPGAFAPTGLLGAGTNTTVWLYVFWHLGLPVAVIAYAVQKRDESRRLSASSVRPTLIACVLLAALLTVLLTLYATVGHDYLFSIFQDTLRFDERRVVFIAVVPLLLLAISIALVWRKPRTQLDLWLALALVAWMAELLLALFSSMRFSAGWYVGRMVGMFSGVCVLVMLLTETSRLYARLSLAIAAQLREREGRFMTLNAVALSVAHEAKQPLAAIVAEAGAGRAFLERDPPELSELAAILEAIESEGQRAGDAVDSIRAMFANRATERHPFDMNKLIRETAALMSAEFAQARVALDLDLAESLPPVLADRRQIQHVLLNLFINAIDALRSIEDRARYVVVRSSRPNPDSLQITVDDSGIGFAPGQLDRIFDAFFTTKPQGSGMGLSLCRSVVQAHGGRLWAEARKPRGAALHVLLPIGRNLSPSD